MVYFIYYKLLVIHTKFQVGISVHSAFIKTGHLQWVYYKEFVLWSTLRPPSTVNFIDTVIYHISTDRALSGESCVAIGENQPNGIKKMAFILRASCSNFKFWLRDLLKSDIKSVCVKLYV